MLTDLRLKDPIRRYLLLAEGDEGEPGGVGSGGASGGEPEGEPEGGKGKGGDEGNKGGEGKSFNQADVDKIGRREKEAGKRAAETKLATDLGVSLDEAKAIIAAHKKAETDALSDTERAKGEAVEAAAKAKSDQDAAKLDRRDAKVERKLIVATGLDPDDKDDARRLQRLLNTVSADLDIEADADAIDEAIKGVREDFPTLFGDEDDGDGSGHRPPPSDRGSGSRRSRQGGDGKNAMERGIERAKTHAGASATGGGSGYSFLDK